METKYRIDRLSYPDTDGQKGKKLRQEITIRGTARTKSSVESEEWRQHIIKCVDKEITGNNLRPIEGNEECNLFVTFYINENRYEERIPDIDNLLKLLLDALKKRDDKYVKLLEKRGRGEHLELADRTYIDSREQERGLEKLIQDDIGFRGVRSEREMVSGEAKVHIQYVMTKTFKIIEVTEKVPGKTYRSYWEHDMQEIKAHEIIDKKESKEYTFIDNMPGQLFLIDNKYAKLIPPGYHWKKHEGEEVKGCMVFMKKVWKKQESKEEKNEKYYWLTKW